MKDKNPYIGFTLDEVRKAEERLWYIQIGQQFFEYEGVYLWDKEEAEHFFFTIRDGLEHMLKTGDLEEREDAREIIINFRMLPLRFN